MEPYKIDASLDANKVFVVRRSELEGRVDSYYYKSTFVNLVNNLYKSSYDIVDFSQLIISINNGFDFRDYKESGTPYLKVANVKKGELDFSKIQYVDFSSEALTKNIKLKKNNILITRKGTYGNCFSLDRDYDYVISSEVFYIEIRQELIDSKYLEIFLNSNIGQSQFERISIGAIMGSISQEALRKYKIPLPPKEIQQQIVDNYKKAYVQKQAKESEAKELLATIDPYLLGELGITLPEKENSLEARIFTTKFSEVIGGRFDAEYYTEYNKLLLISINNSFYQLDMMKNNCDFIPGYAFSSDTYVENSDCVLITIKNISKNSIDVKNVTYLPNEYYEYYKRFKIKKNDLLIAMTGATIGKVGILEKDVKALLNQRNGIIKSDKMNTFYLMNLLNTDLYQTLILRNAVGGAQPNISETDIMKLYIPLPPLEKQNEISEHIATIRANAKALQVEAEQILGETKQQVEQIILG